MTTPDPAAAATPAAGAPTAAAPATPDPAASTATANLAATLDTPAPVFSLDIKGVVTAVFLTTSPPTVTATLNGDTANPVAGIRFIDSYSPNVGDTVLLSQQGSDVYVLGQMNDSVNGTSANGWQSPSLGSGFTSDSTEPFHYRIVVDNGDNKVQCKGAMTISGSPTAILTLAAPYIPAVPRTFVVPRNNDAGGILAALVRFNTDGTVVVIDTSAGSTTSGATTATQNGHTHTLGSGGTYTSTGTSQTHHHDLTGTGSSGGTGEPNNSSSTKSSGVLDGSTSSHDHEIGHDHPIKATSGYSGTSGQDVSHTHDVTVSGGSTDSTTATDASHTHTVDTGGVFPTRISFNGVEFFTAS